MMLGSKPSNEGILVVQAVPDSVDIVSMLTSVGIRRFLNCYDPIKDGGAGPDAPPSSGDAKSPIYPMKKWLQ
jgi:hypothetical protein